MDHEPPAADELRRLAAVLDVLRRSFAAARAVRAGEHRDGAALVRELMGLPELAGEALRNRTNASAQVRWSRFEYARWAHEDGRLLDALGPGSGSLDLAWGQFGIALTALAHAAAVGGPGAYARAAADPSFPRNQWLLRDAGDPGVAVLAVLSVTGARHAADVVDAALEQGMDGVVLTGPLLTVEDLLDCCAAVRPAAADRFLGVGPLATEPVAVVRAARARGDGRLLDGVWAGDARLDPRSTTQPGVPRALDEDDRYHRPGYWGGVPAGATAATARAAAGAVDVLVVPGPDVDVAALVDAAPGLPVAVAGGVTAENVRVVAARAHAVLVPCAPDGRRERERLRALVAAARTD